MRYLIIIVFISTQLFGYEYKIYNKTGKKIRITINYTINEDTRELASGEFKKLDNGLRCLRSIKVLSLQAPYQSDYWDINCNPFTAGISNCCTGFIITINSNFKITLQTPDGKPIRRDKYSDQSQ